MPASDTAPVIRRIDPAEVGSCLDGLASVLADCVAGGASVSFMNPFSHADALAWWEDIAGEVKAGRIVLFGAWIDGELVGTAQLIPCAKPNQPHRADIAKVLVARTARRRGVALALMRALDGEARQRGLTLLTLDTASGEAEALYERSGFTRAGVIPDYALWPDGGYCDTTLYYKRLPD